MHTKHELHSLLNNHKNATGYMSFCPSISSSNATLYSSLDFIKAVVAIHRCPWPVSHP
jgi:hypothetical protein